MEYTNCHSHILEHHFIQIYDPVNAILNELEQLGYRIRGVGEVSYESPAHVDIPFELENCFASFIQGLFPDLSVIPTAQGIDAAVFYFIGTTKILNHSEQREIAYHVAILNIMMAIWLVRTILAGQDYQFATHKYTRSHIEQQLERWGMTIERFFSEFEEVIMPRRITSASSVSVSHTCLHRYSVKHSRTSSDVTN